jgi:copper chaperone CopZ
MSTVTYQIPNINCDHCVHTIKTELSELQGVKSVDASHASKTATIVFDAPADETQIEALLKEINYAPVKA